MPARPFVLSCLLASFVACDPRLPLETATADPDAGVGDFLVTFDPPSESSEVSPAVRIRIEAPPVGAEPDKVVLATGVLGPAHLRQLLTSEISMALSERILPVTVWREPGGALVLAPELLVGGESYSVALANLELGATFTVALESSVLPRTWPPPGLGATSAFGVWCGDEPLAAFSVEARLEPGGPRGTLARGVSGIGARCVSFESPEDAADGGIPPAWIRAGSRDVLLDPRPFLLDADAFDTPPLACAPDEATFGPGCIRVLDDRMLGRSPAASLLWAASADSIDHVFQTSPGDPFVLTPFPSASDVRLHMSAFDTAGRAVRWTFEARTQPPLPHVVINEVLANPLGLEPLQEWIELANDGAAAASLEGYVLADPGGETPLPAVILQPGAFALLVNEGFVENDGFDAPPAGGTLVIRVPRLGKSGLSNEGDPLLLKDASGAVVSACPPGLSAEPGSSVSRRTPSSADVPAEFVSGRATPGARNEI